MNVTLTPKDLAINLIQKLSETEEAIDALIQMRHVVPEEAYEIAGILRRAIVAEQTIANAELKTALLLLTPEQRMALFNDYCHYCGNHLASLRGGVCHCENDD